MNCKDYIIWISGHIDGTNSEKEEASLQRHLEECVECRKVMEQMEANEASLKETIFVVPERVTRNVMASVRHDAKQRRKGYFRRYIMPVAVAAAVLCLVLIGTFRFPEAQGQPHTGNIGENVPTFAQYTEVPTEAFIPTESVVPTEDARPASTRRMPTEAALTTGSVSGNDERKGSAPEEAGPCNCVFVAVASEEIPQDITLLEESDFFSRITKEALDSYFYGDARVIGAAEMTYEELNALGLEIIEKYPQNEDTDTYIVVFAIPAV